MKVELEDDDEGMVSDDISSPVHPFPVGLTGLTQLLASLSGKQDYEKAMCCNG